MDKTHRRRDGKARKISGVAERPVRSIGLFVPMMSELTEMNYQYDRDCYFDSYKIQSTVRVHAGRQCEGGETRVAFSGFVTEPLTSM